MHDDYEIRQLPHTREALKPLVELHHLVLPSRLHSTPEQQAKVLADILAGVIGRDALVLGAYKDDSIVGYKIAYRRGNRHEVLYSWLGGVHPHHRRNGIARALMLKQHEFARANDYRYVETETWGDNAAMLILNLQEGFVAIGTTAGRDRAGVRVILRKSLTEA